MAPAGPQVIGHVGHTCLAEARALATHAQATGADSIAALAPPTFSNPTGVSGLVEWCAQMAAAAPLLPFYYYPNPAEPEPRARGIDVAVIGRRKACLRRLGKRQAC